MFAWVWDVPGRKGPVPVAVGSFSISLYNADVGVEPEAYSWSKEKVKEWLQSLKFDEATTQRLLEIGLGVKELALLAEDDLVELIPKMGPRRAFHSHLGDLFSKTKTLRACQIDVSLHFEGRTIPELTVAGNAVTQKRLGRVTLVVYATGERRRHNNDEDPDVVHHPRGTPLLMVDMRDVVVKNRTQGNHRIGAQLESRRVDFFERGPKKEEFAASFYDAAVNSGGAIAEAKDFPEGLEFPGDELMVDRMEKHMELGGCSFAFTKARFINHQASYACHTCWQPGANKCICAGCRKCHEGHDIVGTGSNTMYCDCGSPQGECPVPCQASATKLA